MKAPSRGLLVAGILALLFGAATLAEGGKTLSLAPELRPQGVVPFVLMFNFSAGFFYLAGGVGLLLSKPWAGKLAMGLAVATALVFAALGVHVALGGQFMPKTVGAMTLRTAFWSAQAWAWRRYFSAQAAG